MMVSALLAESEKLLHDASADREITSDDVQSVDGNVFDINAELLPLVKEKIDKLNKKAATLNVNPIFLDITRSYIKPIKGQNEDSRQDGVGHKMVTIRITGKRPQLAGWDFLAAVEGKTSGNVLRLMPGADTEGPSLERFYHSNPNHCDWCNKHRKRHETFIVRNTHSGELKQIGRNCLKDFLGGRSPQSIAWVFQMYKDLDAYIEAHSRTYQEGGSSKSEHYVPPFAVIATGIALVEKYGYVTSKNDHSTASRVRSGLFDTEPLKHVPGYNGVSPAWVSWNEVQHIVQPIHTQEAYHFIKWVNSLSPEQKAEPFNHNLYVLCNEVGVRSRDVGYLVGAIPNYMRYKNAQLEKETPRRVEADEWIGDEEQKFTGIEVTVISTRLIDSMYGQVQAVHMQDEKGRHITWFNNGKNRLDAGKKYSISGIIKKLDVFNNHKQTLVTHVKATPS